MKSNVSAFDGWFRTLLFVLALCYAVMAGGRTWLWVIPTAVLFVTAVLKWCPLYETFGISTNKSENRP
jgi:hypothetical protein